MDDKKTVIYGMNNVASGERSVRIGREVGEDEARKILDGIHKEHMKQTNILPLIICIATTIILGGLIYILFF